LNVLQFDDESKCFKSLPVTEPVPSQIANACVGREIRFLQSTECDEQGRNMIPL